MAISILFDSANNPLPARLILAKKDGEFIRELPINDIHFQESLTGGSEFSFNVYKNACVGANGKVDEAFWKKIRSFRIAYCPEFDMWYELNVDTTVSTDTVKAVQAISLGEAELSQIKVYELHINDEDDIAREDYVPTVLYNQSNANASLIDRLLYKAPHYRIAHVDESIANIQRTFPFDNSSILDCMNEISEEIGCLFQIECTNYGANGSHIDRKISVWDLENYCLNCGTRGEFSGACTKCGSTSIRYGLGADTTIYVSKDNLAEEITYETNEDSVKNCFRLEAGDDLMTATVVSINPNGSQYIWHFTDEMKEDMSSALRTKLTSYDTLYNNYMNTATYTPDSTLRTAYNNLVTKYSSYKPMDTIAATLTGERALTQAYYNTVDMNLFLEDELMPNVATSGTTAANELAKLVPAKISPAAVANLAACTTAAADSAVLANAKCVVRGTYQVVIESSSYNSSTHTWSGRFTVTNYGDDEDTATSASDVNVIINDDLIKYTEQKIKKVMGQTKVGVASAQELFDLEYAGSPSPFKTELTKYSRQRLIGFRDCCTAVIDVLIQQGAGKTTSEMYGTYTDYRNKMSAIEAEIKTRTAEIETAVGRYDDKGKVTKNGMQSLLIARMNAVQKALDFEKYLGTDLYDELASFRREDTYTNKNYISDGLTNSMIVSYARMFLEEAERELYKSATLQHSISASMHNLLAMQEFRPLVANFGVGNWIRVNVDGDVYRLRLAEYSIDYDTMELDVTFTDVRKGYNVASDIQSILSSAKSMSSSYGTVTRQAKKGEDSVKVLRSWVNDGLKLTTKIVGGANNQEFIIDQTGITGRELYPETGGYSDEQVKIINEGIYYTNNGWDTVDAALGHFEYYDPQTKTIKDGYGVIAHQIVGNLMLGENLRIYNEGSDIQLDENGLTIIANASNNTKGITIKRRESDDSLTTIFSVNANGQLILSDYNNRMVVSSSTVTEYYLSTSSSSATGGSWSTTIPAWSSGKFIWKRQKTTNTYANGTTSTVFSPSANGVYDKALTTAATTASSAASAASNAQTTANNAATAAGNAATAASAAQTTANSANAREQTIYISKASGTTSVTANTTWVTNVTGDQNTWTVRRPEYSSSYPVLFVALQRQTVAQYANGTGTACSCTTPAIDQTTTVIDGGHITTGTIDAGRVNVTNLNADNIASGSLAAARLDSATQTNIANGVSAYNRSTAARATSSTAAATAAKVAASTNFALATGSAVTVYFSTANTSAAALTLNVNSTGAKTVYVAGATTSATNQLLWDAGASITFVYDGTYWRVADNPGNWYGSTCSVAAATAAKTTSVTGIVIFKGVTVSVPMTYANTSTAATLNVSSTGAKNLYYDTTTTCPTTANNRGWVAGRSVGFEFDGAYWRLKDIGTLINGSHITTGTIDASVVSVTNLNASNIKSGTLSAGYISGGTLTLGGASNGSGQLVIKDANGTTVVTGNNGGLTISKGTITAMTLKSSDYSYSSGNYSTAGMEINLTNKTIRTPNFSLTSTGVLYAKSANISGTITSSSISGGTISGATITGGSITQDSLDAKVSVDIYNGLIHIHAKGSSKISEIQLGFEDTDEYPQLIMQDGENDISSIIPGEILTTGEIIGKTLTLTGSKTANRVFAAPNGSNGAPSFRALVAADIPNLSTDKLTSGTLALGRGGTGATTAANARTNLGIGGLQTVTNVTVEAKSLANNTWTQMGSGINFGVGTWLVKVCARFAANATGRRGLCLNDTAPSTRPGMASGIVAAPSPNDYTYIEHFTIIRRNTALTYYVYAMQQSGAALNAEAYVRYIKICD